MSAILLRAEIVHYEVLGRGRPLIFLHDWVGSWRYWIPAMQAASTAFRAYALDFWGFGDSAKNPRCYPLHEQTSLLEEFIQELGLGRVALIGHGLGAVVASLYTAQHPASVERLMLASLPEGASAIHPRLRYAPPPELASWLLGSAPASQAAQVEAHKADPQAIALSLDSLQQIELERLPFRFSSPCLVVHGLNDPAVTAFQPKQNGLLPGRIHHIIFNDSGHFPMLDQPSQFNRLLTDFLNMNGSGSLRDLRLKEEWKRRVR